MNWLWSLIHPHIPGHPEAVSAEGYETPTVLLCPRPAVSTP
jgi:hypothetical protein